MNSEAHPLLVLCNGASGPADGRTPLLLNYLGSGKTANVRVGLPSFVKDVFHLPHRILDLLEIAAYVFAADRKTHRGPKDAVEYHAWSRALEFHIRVRDLPFWTDPETQEALSSALRFMTGHASVNFVFEGGHSTPPTSLFDRSEFLLNSYGPAPLITLFSGGIDSLCGSVESLANTDSRLLLVSHQSQPGTTRTQRMLATALAQRFGRQRLSRYEFDCTLKGMRATEETQRTRSFLYTSIAFAIARAFGVNEFVVYENGVTSLNLHRREDLANARASRTTHPQTMARMASLFSLVAQCDFRIRLPFLFSTKREVFMKLKTLAPSLISSAVSCSRTFQTVGETTHCGYCFQCVDRRLAAYSAESEDLDHRGLYTNDIISQPITDREARTTIVDYVRQAGAFAVLTLDAFAANCLSELAEVIDYLPGTDSQSDKLYSIWDLVKRHGNGVRSAIERIRSIHDDPYRPLAKDSLLSIVAAREHLKPEVVRLAQTISSILTVAIPEMFSKVPPIDENDLNKKVGALLRTHDPNLRSEHPTRSFACARVVPDHLLKSTDLFVEAKFIREGTTPSKATDGIASDLTKYPETAHVLFVVYDPKHGIVSDDVFRTEIESKGRNTLLILR